MLAGEYLDPHKDRSAWQDQFEHRLGRFGYPFHLAFAVLWCAGVSGPMSVVEMVGIPVAITALLRLPFIWRTLFRALGRPVVIASVAWALWICVTLLWTPDLAQGAAQEAGKARWMLGLILLAPVMDRRSWLVRGAAAGVALGVVFQVLEWAGVHWNVPALVWKHPPEPGGMITRCSGWWSQPAVGGTMLAGALGLHLPAAFFARGKARWISIGGVLLTGVGLVLTGTRGAWLASGGLVALVACARVVCGTGSFERRRAALGIAGVVMGLVVLGAGVWFASPAVRTRVEHGWQDVRRAVVEGDYASDTGRRLLMARWALDAVVEHPLGGVGAGGFRSWAESELLRRGGGGEWVLAQAHNTALHSLATTGIVGFCLMTLVVAAALASNRPGGGFAGWAAGDGGALTGAILGLVLVSAFDTVYVNTSTAAFATMLVALAGGARIEGASRRE